MFFGSVIYTVFYTLTHTHTHPQKSAAADNEPSNDFRGWGLELGLGFPRMQEKMSALTTSQTNTHVPATIRMEKPPTCVPHIYERTTHFRQLIIHSRNVRGPNKLCNPRNTRNTRVNPFPTFTWTTTSPTLRGLLLSRAHRNIANKYDDIWMPHFGRRMRRTCARTFVQFHSIPIPFILFTRHLTPGELTFFQLRTGVLLRPVAQVSEGQSPYAKGILDGTRIQIWIQIRIRAFERASERGDRRNRNRNRNSSRTS